MGPLYDVIIFFTRLTIVTFGHSNGGSRVWGKRTRQIAGPYYRALISAGLRTL